MTDQRMTLPHLREVLALGAPTDHEPPPFGEPDSLQQDLNARLDASWSAAPDEDAAVDLAVALRGAALRGKRFRPRLVRLVHDCLGGTEPQAVTPVATAVELLHTAFVVHDDVIDGDDVRRGHESVPGRFFAEGIAAGADARAARTYAVAGAVLTGDLALSAAIRTIATAPLETSVVRRLLDLVDATLVESAVGELADVRYSLDVEAPSMEQVLRMEEHKTAVYSFALPMQAGAVLAGAAPGLIDGMSAVGRLLGVSFQLRDDLAGMFGEPTRTGKSDIADLREGKCTPIMVHARTTPQWPLIAPHVGDCDVTFAEAEEVRRALHDSGSRAFVERLAADYADAATTKAAELAMPDGFVERLTALCWPPERGVA